MTIESDIEIARTVAAEAAELALTLYESTAGARNAHRDIDREVEESIRKNLAERRPEYAFLGEETGRWEPATGPDPQAPTWVVDPIDGTGCYRLGLPLWAVLIALRVGGENVLGVVHAPVLHEVYWATLGAGAYLGEKSIRVQHVGSLADATVLFGHDDRPGRPRIAPFVCSVLKRCARSRGLGNFWGHMLVARGSAHAMLEPQDDVGPWDLAAIEPIVREAGGVQSGLDGQSWTRGACVTSCGSIHDELIRVINAEAG